MRSSSLCRWQKGRKMVIRASGGVLTFALLPLPSQVVKHNQCRKKGADTVVDARSL